MKSLFLWLFIAIGPCFALAQTKVKKSYPVGKNQTIDFRFDYPKNIYISTWIGNEINIEAQVNINNGKTDQAFSLVETSTAGRISIANKLDLDLIPDSYYIMQKGVKTQFSSKKDLEAHLKTLSGPRPSIYQNKDINIDIHIKVPVNVNTKITSVYGLVEVSNFNGPIHVDATYGGIDASLTEKAIGRLQLITRYGKIFSNLSLKPIEKIEKDFFTSITAVPGKGPGYHLNSSYGNIYLRSTNK
ncbi:hypothetical protein IWX76_002818 [Pedobacter sp. CAN_A7]|uniref:hypothetical protein n=1 Tax=Pedobacter sp. CAN_A7 TaxID=2787722 RepID=UPI0018CA2349